MAETISTKSLAGRSVAQTDRRPLELVRQPAPSGAQTEILALQRAIGNQAVSQLLQLSTSSKPPATNSMRPNVASALKNSSGQPLDSTVRVFMESRFGYDFADVRVHSDASAADTARTLKARAFTLGRNVFFASGEYRPTTPEGRKVLAHELTHVIQQRGTTASTLNHPALGRHGDHYEREAEATSESVLTRAAPPKNGAPIASAVPTPMVQRLQAPEHVLTGDPTQAALSQMMGLLSSAEVELRRGRSAWRELVLARDLWEQKNGDPAALNLLSQATFANDEGRFEVALRAVEQATPVVMAWLRTHPEAGGGRTTKIAGREHPEIQGLLGQDAARPLTLKRSGVQVTYGEVIALGDFYQTPEDMHNAERSELTNPEGKGILDLIRAEVTGRQGVNFDQAYQEATEWRDVKRYDNLGEKMGYASGKASETSYLSLARNNPEHFTEENRKAWEKHHTDAVNEADQARKEQGLSTRTERANRAFTINAFGDHFLTDAFAGGHLLYKANYMVMAGDFWKEHKEEVLDAVTIALLNDHWGRIVGLVSKAIPVPVLGFIVGFFVTLFAPDFVRNKIKKKIRDLEDKKPDVLLNAAVKVAHDYYNEKGVEVKNKKGDRWQTFGDDHLKKSAATWQLASLAVLRSRADVRESLKGPLQSDLFDAWGYTPIPPTRFDKAAFEVARSLMLRRRDNPLANLFIKNLPAIEQAEATEKEEEKRDKEAEKKRKRYRAYLDYIRTNNRIENRSDSDDVAREIVANTKVYATLTLREKAILVLEMLEGSTGGDDERAILLILQDVQQRGQLRNLLQWVPIKRLKSKINGAEHQQLLVILRREGLQTD